MAKKRLKQHDGASRAVSSPAKPPPSASQVELTAAKEQLLRVQADWQNYRRRAEAEKAKVGAIARTDIILDILPVIDNFERAFAQAPDDVKDTSWYAGIVGIKQQFDKIVTDLGVTRIASVGKPFDPNLHEAVGKEPSEQYQSDVVSKEFEAGYQLGDEVIRHAKVQVSSGQSAAK